MSLKKKKENHRTRLCDDPILIWDKFRCGLLHSIWQGSDLDRKKKNAMGPRLSSNVLYISFDVI